MSIFLQIPLLPVACFWVDIAGMWALDVRGGDDCGFARDACAGGWCYRGYCRYPWAWGWYGGVGVGWSGAYYPYPARSYPLYDDDGAPDSSGAYIAYRQQQVIDRLNDEAARLRAKQPSAALANPVAVPSAEQIGDTVLVFRDRRSEAIQNYAIVDETLWVFAGQRARRMPIADLDVSATAKVNEARGIYFWLPGH